MEVVLILTVMEYIYVNRIIPVPDISLMICLKSCVSVSSVSRRHGGAMQAFLRLVGVLSQRDVGEQSH